MGHNAVCTTNITFGLGPIWDTEGSLCLRDMVPSSQLQEVPCPSPLSQTLSSLENPGTSAPHQRFFIEVSDQGASPSPTSPLTIPESSAWPTGPNIPCLSFLTELSSYCSLPTPAGAQAFSLFPIGTKQAHALRPSHASLSPNFCKSLSSCPLPKAIHNTQPSVQLCLSIYCIILQSSLCCC